MLLKKWLLKVVVVDVVVEGLLVVVEAVHTLLVEFWFG